MSLKSSRTVESRGFWRSVGPATRQHRSLQIAFAVYAVIFVASLVAIILDAPDALTWALIGLMYVPGIPLLIFISRTVTKWSASHTEKEIVP